jgi:hypothetical protein
LLEPLLWLEPATLDTTEIPAHATEPAYVAAMATYGPGRIAICATVLTDFRSSSHPAEAVEGFLRNLFAAP